MKLKKHIFLIGFMGVGKTTTSECLSRKLQAEEIDTDEMIVAREGRSIADIFAEEGEPYFRQAETDLLDELAQREPCIISCGGGMAMREENVARMKRSGTVIFLTATPETIYERVKDCDERPLLKGNMNIPYIRGLMEERDPKYRRAADIVTATDGMAPDQVAEQIILSLQA